jgi:hypothetical protein
MCYDESCKERSRPATLTKNSIRQSSNFKLILGPRDRRFGCMLIDIGMAQINRLLCGA